MRPKTFGDYASEGRAWITVMESDYYPDFLDAARAVYSPVLERFAQLARAITTSADLLREIVGEPMPTRVQLMRVFRRYVSPDTSVEMLKKVSKVEDVVTGFGDRFRPIDQVRKIIASRPKPDDALITLLFFA